VLYFSNSALASMNRKGYVSIGAYVAKNWYLAAISLLTSSRLRYSTRYRVRNISLKGSQTGSIGLLLVTELDMVEGYWNETQIKGSLVVLRIGVLWIGGQRGLQGI
jgi:hypothetical protein